MSANLTKHWQFGLWTLATLCPSAALSATAEADIRRDAAVVAIEQVMPSVVNIATERVIEYHEWYDDLLRQFYGWPRTPVWQQKSVSLGSGVIIDDEGYVLTNFHVVRRASRIQVKLWDGREYEADALMATLGSDVALLKLRAKPGEKFKAMKLAADDDLLLGETVLALGNPFGLGGSVTKGILSSKNRRPSTGIEQLDVQDWLQTDAAINPGNSGGPLVNLRGELIGLNVAVYRGQGGERGMGVGFSIPAKQISAALSRFFSPESTASLWFGAELKAGPSGLAVMEVQPGSPAAKAGVRVGDQVLEIDGQAAHGLIGSNRLLGAATNHPARLLINRDRERQTLTVRLMPFTELIRQRLGLTLVEATPERRAQLGVSQGEWLYIDAVEKDSPSERAQLQPGFLLAAIDDQGATDLRAAGDALVGKKPGEEAQLTVIGRRRLGASSFQFRQTVDVPVR